MKYLIVGLGNIGEEYAKTRHNAGFMVVDAMAAEKGLSFNLSRHALTTEYKFKGRSLHLIKPTTYMNLSGKAVRYWMNELKVPVENTLVIVDEIALPFASLRMRSKGSAAGHNGLQHIEDFLGTKEYPRLRFGVGNDFQKGGQVDYVLSEFTPEEQKQLPEVIEKAVEMVKSFSVIGINRTMSEYND